MHEESIVLSGIGQTEDGTVFLEDNKRKGFQRDPLPTVESKWPPFHTAGSRQWDINTVPYGLLSGARL